MRILVACESSGVTREALRRRGHDAWSCDFLPAKDGSAFHYQCDMREIVGIGWDGMVFHPDCTFLTISAEWAYKDPDFERYPGVGYHQKVMKGTLVGEERRKAREEAIAFAVWGMGLDIPRIIMENPVGVLSTRYRKADFSVQPYQFGDDASKRTCFWVKGLGRMLIDPQKRKEGRWVEWPRGSGKMVERWANQTDSGQNKLSPGEDRWDIRSKTYPGIAEAIADLFEADGVEKRSKCADNVQEQVGKN